MKTFKKLSIFGTALLLASSMGTAYAEEGDVTRTQDRIRTESNLQSPSSDFGQSRNRAENMVINKNQNQNQYKHMNKYQNGGVGSAEASQQNGNEAKKMRQDSNTSRSMDRMNTINRAMQGRSVAGSMNRQSSSNGSMGSGRR